jgi:hypothetical protein
VKPRVGLVLVALLAAAVVPAEAATIPTRWTERMRVDGKVAMTFNTRAITISGRSWSVAASFKNNMTRPIRIVVQRPGVAAATTPPKPGQKYELIRATSVSPAFPKSLQPGQVWRGTFRGGGIPTWSTYLSAAYGDFEPIPGKTTKQWRWITDQALRR